MDSLVSTAIVGTGQLSNQELTTGTPIDTLVAQLGTGEIERNLLLAAGSLALYRQAGRIPELAPEPPQPAVPESIHVCTSKVAHLLQGLLQGEQRELLPEALYRLKQGRQRLPYDLLPLALGYGAQSREIRPALFAVLGERGRWLSQFDKTWAWATQFLADTSTAIPDDAETIWQEGTLGQRSQLLARIRSGEPARAREWLADVWKKEKAEARLDLIKTFLIGLSPDDEAFLENALDDRSDAVRSLSASFLARLPTSALAQRMLTRANALLTSIHGEFNITLPPEIDASWRRDGITAPPHESTDAPLWYARQVLLSIPPPHWEERFSISPPDIIASLTGTIHANQEKMQQAASKGTLMESKDENALAELLLGCWSHAATLFESPNWIEPLWAWGCANINSSATNLHETEILGQCLPQKVAEKYVLTELAQAQNEQWTLLLPVLPTPWSKDFGDACLDTLRKHILTLDGQSYPTGQWQITLNTIIQRLPPTCFEAALAPWQFPENITTWQIQQWKNQLKTFKAFVRKRQQIIEEI